MTQQTAPVGATGKGQVGDPWFPEIEVRLTGNDGNAMVIIGSVSRVLRRANVPYTEVSRFTEEAMSGDYDNVLQTAMRWVEVS